MTVTLRGMGGRGLLKIYILIAAVVSEKFMERLKGLKRSIRVLKCIYAWNISPLCMKKKKKTVRV